MEIILGLAMMIVGVWTLIQNLKGVKDDYLCIKRILLGEK